MSLEALSAAIDQRFDSIGILRLFRNGDQHSIDPSSGFDTVQAADDELELLVKLLVKVLDPVIMSGDFNALHSLLDELRCHFGLEFSHI